MARRSLLTRAKWRKCFAKGYDINSLHEAGLQVDRTISAMTMFKKLIESEKKRLETKDRVCITPRPTCNHDIISVIMIMILFPSFLL